MVPRLLERSHPTSGSAQAGAWLLAFGITGAALAAGTVQTVPLCVVTAVLAAATALIWWDAEPSRARLPATVLFVSGAALISYTALQALPMPIGWLAVIAPHNADVWSRALSPLHEAGPRWAPLSLDPKATRIELLRGIAYLLAFIAAVRIAVRRQGVAFLSAIVVGTGLVLAVAALLHPAFGAKKLYGIWGVDASDGKRFEHLAPLLNPNNLAGYINLALCTALGAAIGAEPPVPRPILAAVVVVLAGTQIWVASRGGVAAMLLGAVLVGLIARIARRQGRSSKTLPLVTGLVAAAGAAAFVLGASDRAASELLDTTSSKLQLFTQSMRMVAAVPLWGVGRGAFESTFPAFRSTVGHLTFSHPENVVAQWLVEWGVPVGLAGLGALAYALRPGAATVRSSRAAGAWAGLAALAVQNLVDLGSEIPGLVLGAVICSAIVVGGSEGRRERWRVERWARSPRLLAILGPVVASLLIVSFMIDPSGELAEDRAQIKRAGVEQQLPRERFDPLGRASMLRHPAEPYIPFVAAWRAAAVHDESPIPWLEATFERAHVYGPAHLLLASLLVARSPSQARFEYRLAVEQAPEWWWLVATDAARLVGSYDDALELVPRGT
ncbi:MAG: O-antigen ligase family protein, partial [Polyangiaceae bacterium]